jgi:uncharacterized phage-like protein YoqJ
MSLIISCTGHRPEKLPNKETGYILPNPTYNKICQETEKLLIELKPDKVMSGMALGYDQYFANIAIKLNIPLIAIIPHEGQERIWLKASQILYNKLRSQASEEIIVSSGGYSAYKMQIRNQYLVNNCDLLIACFDGDPKGRTYNCVKYAESIKKEVIIIDPKLVSVF